MIGKLIIVHGVPVHRAVGMRVGDEMRLRMGADRGIERVVVVFVRSGFGRRNERCLNSERHRRCHHYDGNAPTNPRPGTSAQLHTLDRPREAMVHHTQSNAKLNRATARLVTDWRPVTANPLILGCRQ